MAGADEGWPGQHAAAWSTANAAAQRLARNASIIVSSLHQVRVPTASETQQVKDSMAELVKTLDALSELEKADG